MATIDVQQSAAITIPAAYLEDARRALAAEIHDDADALRIAHPVDTESSARILRRDMQLLEQLLGATEDTTVKSVQDRTSDPIADMLGAMVRVISKRLEDVCRYGPLPMGNVLDIAERPRWAADEVIRLCPDLDHRLTADELAT